MRQLLSALAVSSLLASGCAPAEESATQGVDLEAERASLMEADRAFYEAYSTSDSPLDALVAHFLDDARVLPPDAPMAQGVEEIRAVFGALEALPGYSLAWSPSTADVGGAGDLGYTIGAYHIEFKGPEGTPLAIDGKYTTVWKKQSDGAWKVAVDMFNGDGAPTPVAE